MRAAKILFIFVFFISLITATSHSGDGTYTLFIGDDVTSDNDYEVTLHNITWSSGPNQSIILDSAIFNISREDILLTVFTLESGQSESTSVEEGKENLTVTVEALNFTPGSSGITTVYIPSRPYANVTVESVSYVPPPPDVEVTYVQAHQSKFYANISWATNTSANATLFIYNKTSLDPFKSIIISDEDTFHKVKVTGLKSDTNYDAIVEACTENSCAKSYTKSFKTNAVVPIISDVTVAGTTNDTAIITWKTDVISDSRVYYRKLGTSEWSAVPPVLPWLQIKKFFIFNFSDSTQEQQDNVMYFSGKSSSSPSASLAPISVQTLDIDAAILPEEDTADYTIQSDYLGGIYDIDAIKAIVKQYHSIKLYDLEDNTTYQYKVSSCADRCINSSTGTFKTEFTVQAPHARFVSAPSSVNHGTSAVLLISSYSKNPNGYIKDIKVEWNDGGSKSLIPKLGGDPKSFIHYDWPMFSVISITFQNSGNHQVKLSATDSYNKTKTDTINIYVNPKTKCTATSTKYYPSDTPCNNKWPSGGGSTIDYNNGIGACNAFEVCDNNLDYMIADAESCCNGEFSFSANPTKNRGYGYNKSRACAFALANTRNKGPIENLGSHSSMKICKASYLVYSIGSEAVYMKDYYTAEACCKASSFCDGYPHYQSWNPWPQSNIKFNELWCYWNDYWIFGKSPKNGWYGSDTNPESNNNALADIPAHASVNTMNTGTCVDYSFVVTTALRKAGFGKNEIMSIRTPGHLYNAVWLPGDNKYSFIDTVGNNGGDFFTGPGWGWDTSKKKNLDHCQYDSNRCSNDAGMRNCPSKSNMYGC
jgi:hypothetical protein